MLEVDVATGIDGFALAARFIARTPGVIALFGPSGCGKTTLINLIAGLRRADRAFIRLDDEILADSARHFSLPVERRRIGYVFQDARLFPHLRVRANLCYGTRRSSGIGYARFDDVVEMLDLGALLARRTHQLSGGERQRVAIGRALLSQPKMLLLDEPLASLDASRRDEVLPYLEVLRDAYAVPMIYVSHNFDEALRLATHMVVMREGSVSAQGEMTDMSLDPRLTELLRPDEVGAILDGISVGIDATDGLLRVRVGRGELRLADGQAFGLAPGVPLRLQILARDVIVATQPPSHLSVRNALSGSIVDIRDDGSGADHVLIDVGGARLMARITRHATRELALAPGRAVWALVKAVSLQGHYFKGITSNAYPRA